MPNALDSGLYPAPPSANSGLLTGDPSRLLSVLPGLADFQARQSVGNALRGSVDPSGNFDPAGFSARVARDPSTSLRAGEAVQFAQDLQRQQFELAAAQRSQLANMFATFAGDETAKPAKVMDFVTRGARGLGIPIPRMLQYKDYLLNAPPGQFQSRLADIQLELMGPAGRATITEGPTIQGGPLAGTRPQTTAGQVVRPALGAGAAGVTGLPTGQTEAGTAIGAYSGTSANRLTEANDTSMTRKAMLGNLEEDLQHFTAGPGADWTKFAKAWINRNVPLPKDWQFDPKSIASQEAFNKQAYMLAASQFQAIGGTGTDEKFGAAFQMNPNETMSQLGNQGVIRLLKGNEDAIQAKNKAWRQWLKTHPPQSYPEFSDNFNAHFDPRVFQFRYLPNGERQGYFDRMDKTDQQAFLAAMTHARKEGWISFETPK